MKYIDMYFWIPFFYLLGAAFLGGIIGWIWRRKPILALEEELGKKKSRYASLQIEYDTNLNAFGNLNKRYDKLVSNHQNLNTKLIALQAEYDRHKIKHDTEMAGWENKYASFLNSSKKEKQHLEFSLTDQKVKLFEQETAYTNLLSNYTDLETAKNELESSWQNKYQELANEKDEERAALERKIEILQIEHRTIISDWGNRYKSLYNEKDEALKEWEGKYHILSSEKEEALVDWQQKYEELLEQKEADAEEWNNKLERLSQDLGKANSEILQITQNWSNKHKELEFQFQTSMEEKNRFIANWEYKYNDLEKDNQIIISGWETKFEALNQEMQELQQKMEAIEEAWSEKYNALKEEHIDLQTAYAEKPKEIVKEIEVIKEVVNLVEIPTRSLEPNEFPVESQDDAIKTEAVSFEIQKDKLQKIEGIGPKIEQLLFGADIYTYEDLANSKKKKLKRILEKAGSRYRMHNPESWPQQSRLAARGDWDELARLQDKLHGGRLEK